MMDSGIMMKTDEKISEEIETPQVQYILDENGNLTEILKKDTVPVEYPIKYRLLNAFEVFVRIPNTESYWISNYGRMINNAMHSDKTKFYEHKQGNVHYTIYEKWRVCTKKARGKKPTEYGYEKVKRETSPEELVAKNFLINRRTGSKIWHKDGNTDNNYYKNLLWVTAKEYKRLKKKEITYQDLRYKQEYIEYENNASTEAIRIYYGIKRRCCNTGDSSHKCYRNVYMCQEWIDDYHSFVKWYLEHYYSVPGEVMAVDKDLFSGRSKCYSPDTCCILPQRLNSLLANCKKSYAEGQTKENTLPLGIYYNSKTRKYHGEIILAGSERTTKLTEWDTAEAAFEEYRIMKKASIMMVLTQYLGKIPDYIYRKLLEIEIEPY